ncbi:MAG TPA: CYTH and CHAD domain-containing protein [Actinomycetes bacterium]
MEEREAKLAAPDEFQLPDLNGGEAGFLAEPQPVRRYTTTYWDTPDLRLARWHVSLRYRDDEGWTVKLPSEQVGPMVVRQEHTFPGTPRKVPQEAADLVRAFVRGAKLAPVARLRAVRRPVALRNAAGEELAEVVDDEVRVIAADGRRVAGRFRELEVELTDHALPDTLDRVLASLRAAGARDADGASKYRRALGDREVGPPELDLGELPARPSVEDLLRHDLTASVLRLFRHEAGVRIGEDPEAVHQARVACRRIRSTLRTFKSVLEPEWTARLRDELKWIAADLGGVRDADVLLAGLERGLATLPEADQAPGRRLLASLEGERDHARERLIEAMGEDRYAALLDDLVAAAVAPAVLADAARPAAGVLPPLAASAWSKLRKAVRRAGDEPSDEALHKIRIRAKRLRYAVEAIAPVMGKPARRLAKAAADLQDVLGDQHDAVVAEAWLRRTATNARRDQAVVAGELVALQQAAAARDRARWPKAWKALSKKRMTSWL